MNAEFLAFHGVNTLILVLVSWSVFIAWRASMFTLGFHGMVAVGAYSAALVLRATGTTEPSILLFIATLVAAAGGAAVFALMLIALFTRVSSDYFAVGTLAAAEMVRIVLSNTSYLGGSLGFQTPDLVALQHRSAIYLVLLVVAALLLLTALVWYQTLLNAPYGLAISAVNCDAQMAEFLGVDSRGLRTGIFVIGSAFAGLAGALTLNLKLSVTPSDFGFVAYINVLLVVILASKSHYRLLLWGAIVYGLAEAIRSNVFGLDPAIASYREMLLASVLLTILLVKAWIERPSVDGLAEAEERR